jgi:hypothetical protein
LVRVLACDICLGLQIVLREFLNPRGWKPSEDSKFFLDAEQINQLCDVAEQILQAEPSVLRLKGIPFLFCLDLFFFFLFFTSLVLPQDFTTASDKFVADQLGLMTFWHSTSVGTLTHRQCIPFFSGFFTG